MAKRHLRVSRITTRAACGLKDPQHWTFDPPAVTCGGCSKTLLMADAEVRQQRPNEAVQSVNRKGRQ